MPNDTLSRIGQMCLHVKKKTNFLLPLSTHIDFPIEENLINEAWLEINQWISTTTEQINHLLTNELCKSEGSFSTEIRQFVHQGKWTLLPIPHYGWKYSLTQVILWSCVSESWHQAIIGCLAGNSKETIPQRQETPSSNFLWVWLMNFITCIKRCVALSIRHFIHTHSSAKIFPKSHNVLIKACFITGATTNTSKLFSILGRNAVIFKSMIEDPTHGPVVNATLEKAKIIGKSYNQGITTVVNAVHDHQGKKTKPPFLPKNIFDMITRREIKSPTSPKCDILTIMSKYHEIQTPLSTLSLGSNYKQFREKWIVTNMNKSTPLKHNKIVLLEEKAI